MQDRLFKPIVTYVKKTRSVLDQPGSLTGRLVSIWAKIMVFPQFLLMPFSILFGAIEGPLIFLARFLAMHVVLRLEPRMPYHRVLGLCHIVTFGPLFLWFSYNFASIYTSWGIFGPVLVIEYAIIALCLTFDTRDLVLELLGRPFPCYIRDFHRLGVIKVDDKRIEQPVTFFSTLFW